MFCSSEDRHHSCVLLAEHSFTVACVFLQSMLRRAVKAATPNSNLLKFEHCVQKKMKKKFNILVCCPSFFFFSSLNRILKMVSAITTSLFLIFFPQQQRLMATHLLAACALLKSSASDNEALGSILSARLDHLQSNDKNRTISRDMQQPSAIVERVTRLVSSIQQNGASLDILETGRLMVGMPSYEATTSQPSEPSNANTASHVGVIRSMRPKSASKQDSTFPTPQQLVDAALPGDIIVLRPSHMYMDEPIKITTPFITIKGGGRRILRGSSVRGASRADYHCISLSKNKSDDACGGDEEEEELVPKTDTVLHNRTDRAAISIHAPGVRIKGLSVYQLSHEAPAISVHIGSDAAWTWPPNTVARLTGQGDVTPPPSSLGPTAVFIANCNVTSMNCHAIHATNTVSSTNMSGRGDEMMKADLLKGGLEVRNSIIKSTNATGIQIGLLGSGSIAPALHSSEGSSMAIPRVNQCVIEGLTLLDCGVSGISLFDPRCELLSINKCTIVGSGRYGIHFAEVAPPPPPTALQGGKVSRASSALRRPGSAALTRASHNRSGDTSLLRAIQQKYLLAIDDTLIRDPKICGIVIEAGRVVSRIQQTTALLTVPNSVGLYLSAEGSLLEAVNNSF